MSAAPAQSFLRVEVAFSDPVYFAGEELECRITFRNIAPTDLPRVNSSSRLRKSSFASISETASSEKPSTVQRSASQHSLHGSTSMPVRAHRHSSASGPTGNALVNGSASPQSLSTTSSNGMTSPTFNSLPTRRSSMRVSKTRSGETLMMGYAQLSGSFTLDESLVKTAVFEEAKKQGIVGGKMGGGVVGLGPGKNDNGYLWGLGLGLSSGLSNLLNGREVSSIAEMKSMASSNSISIISTPQSLLFVDLRLNPGESKSYSYKITLPRTLPPSYRGKALKISYNLTIGIQRIGQGMQQPKITKFPFRVFQNIDAGGNQPVHSLTSPIVILRDEAITQATDDSETNGQLLKKSDKPAGKQRVQAESDRKESLEDFMAYVDTLLSYKSSDTIAKRIIRPPSPTSPPEYPTSNPSSRSSCRESVDLAIQRNSISADGLALNNIFEIARNKQKIATITLSKPVYKLGEIITLALDFSQAVLPCYHITASLETTEIIDPEIVHRSPAFNERATRKVYLQSAFSTLASKRASFSFCIPTTATPQFDTSYISSRWSIRLEFVTIPIKATKPSLPSADDELPSTPPSPEDQFSPPTSPSAFAPIPIHPLQTSISAMAQDSRYPRSLPSQSRSSLSLPVATDIKPNLLVCTHKDDRGSTFSVVENISCETFDCRIPIKVFPTNQDIAAMSFQIQPSGGYPI
ncbi:Rgp1-domain-containing protein [Lipomyces chichibuensis]|uniref:Rgp1-domain-containing protein n=1 Tax=Lipomyces chichibuensis TaxID=1546026 RepID=UPI00334396D4